MRDEIKTKLEAVFQKHEAAKSASESARLNAENKERVLLDSFLKVRDEIIRPAMQEVANYVEQQGYRCSITTEAQTSFASDLARTPASIRFTLFLDRPTIVVHEHPGFAVIFTKGSDRVRLAQSTISPGRSGQSGDVGEAKIEEITADLIQEKVMAVVAAVFR